jgi:charged multivesicular body protein 5
VQQRALGVLKQKKMYEAQLTQLTQQTFNMESAALVTENLRNTMATVDAMKVANKELKKQYGKVDIDKIEVCGLSMKGCCSALMLRSRRKCGTRWRTWWSRQTKYRIPWADHMRCRTNLTKLIWKRVGRPPIRHYWFADAHAELDALALEEEDEGPSYLADLNKAPDFIDEAPTEEVGCAFIPLNGLN